MTEAILEQKKVIPSQVETIVGLWAWVMLVSRGGLSIFQTIYHWIREHRERKQAILWATVRQELETVVALSVYFEADMSVEWHPWIYMADASPYGHAAVATKTDLAEVRDAAAEGECAG